jgi:hypothetical protein
LRLVEIRFADPSCGSVSFWSIAVVPMVVVPMVVVPMVVMLGVAC